MPVVRLTEVFRQAAQSRIITSAHRINQGVDARPRRARGRERLLFRGGERARDRRSRGSSNW